jgi:uncharacterized phage protein (TIGR01671 family)
MREIKFRCWDDKIKRMISWEDMLLEEWFLGDLQGWDDLNIMQFTGLYDRTGKEIWERDIVKTFNIRDNIVGKIQWNNDRLTWMIHPPSWHKNTSEHLFYYRGHIEVIGNIYENPELLK